MGAFRMCSSTQLSFLYSILFLFRVRFSTRTVDFCECKSGEFGFGARGFNSLVPVCCCLVLVWHSGWCLSHSTSTGLRRPCQESGFACVVEHSSRLCFVVQVAFCMMRFSSQFDLCECKSGEFAFCVRGFNSLVPIRCKPHRRFLVRHSGWYCSVALFFSF